MATPPATGKAPAHPISSVENAIRLLLLLRDQRTIRVSEASEILGVARSTAHRLIAMLQSYQLIEQDPTTRAYGVGPALAELGLSSVRHNSALTAMRPFLEELRETVGETVHLIVREGRNCRFVDSVEGKHALRTTARVGVVFPAYVTSAGKALLAELDDREIRRLYPQRALVPLNERSISSRDQLLKELARVREQGFATAHGESELGISAVAMVQRTARGDVPAAVAISAPEQRLPKDRVPELVEALQETTDRARSRLP